MTGSGDGHALDLKLNLAPNSASASLNGGALASSPSSCVSSEPEEASESSPKSMAMVLAACPRCLMYVMLSQNETRCPRCRSTVLLDFLHEYSNKTKKR